MQADDDPPERGQTQVALPPEPTPEAPEHKGALSWMTLHPVASNLFMFVLLMSGLIVYQTGEIVHGGETNYILATVTLFVTIYKLFLSLLQLLGVFAGDE